jgi:hypothetical protein
VTQRERFPVGTILSIPHPAGSRTRRCAQVLAWQPLAGTDGVLVLRLLADDDEKRDQETPQDNGGISPVDDGHFDEERR